jgi:hypothetical protein
LCCGVEADMTAISALLFFAPLVSACGANYGACAATTCCDDPTFGCFQRSGSDLFAECRPMPADGPCEDSEDWLCPLSAERHFQVFPELKTWADARDACHELGGSLAGAHTRTAGTMLHRYLLRQSLLDTGDSSSYGFSGGMPPATYWIGGNDIETEGVYVWESSALTFPPTDAAALSYSNWKEGEPNDTPGWYEATDTEDCVEINLDSGQWNDRTCGYAQAYVCESIPPPAAPPVPPAPPAPPHPPPSPPASPSPPSPPPQQPPPPSPPSPPAPPSTPPPSPNPLPSSPPSPSPPPLSRNLIPDPYDRNAWVIAVDGGTGCGWDAGAIRSSFEPCEIQMVVSLADNGCD